MQASRGSHPFLSSRVVGPPDRSLCPVQEARADFRDTVLGALARCLAVLGWPPRMSKGAESLFAPISAAHVRIWRSEASQGGEEEQSSPRSVAGRGPGAGLCRAACRVRLPGCPRCVQPQVTASVAFTSRSLTPGRFAGAVSWIPADFRLLRPRRLPAGPGPAGAGLLWIAEALAEGVRDRLAAHLTGSSGLGTPEDATAQLLVLLGFLGQALEALAPALGPDLEQQLGLGLGELRKSFSRGIWLVAVGGTQSVGAAASHTQSGETRPPGQLLACAWGGVTPGVVPRVGEGAPTRSFPSPCSSSPRLSAVGPGLSGLP